MFETPIESLMETKLPLRCRADGKFRLLVLSDLHGGVGCSEQMFTGIEETVAAVKPDLVLLNGDTAGPGRIHVETPEQLGALLDRAAAPMESRGIPWCHVFGNHDDNFGVSNAEAQKVYESYAHCVSKAGESFMSGVGNYVLPVYSHSGEAVVGAVWGFDSHSGMAEFSREFGLPEDTRYVLPQHAFQGRGYDTLHVNQVLWYYTASIRLEQYCGKKVPGVMCFHIPLPEFVLCCRNRDETDFEGSEGENVGCGEMNSGVFQAILERGDVKAVCCGHDHINDFSAVYCGVKLCYDGGMDYDAYQRDEIRGGRVFEFDENDPQNIRTYMAHVKDIMGVRGNKIRRG